MSEMERIDRAADYVRDVLGTAEIAIVLGSGLGDYAEVLTDAQVAPIMIFPVSRNPRCLDTQANCIPAISTVAG